MQTWNYIPGRKGFVSSETIPSSDSIVKTKNVLMGWDLKTAFGFVHTNKMVVPGEQAIENHCFEELNYQDMIRKQLPDNSVREALISKVNGEKLINPLMVNTNAFSLEDESTSRLSSPVLESNRRDSSFIDLKLGRFGDPAEVDDSRISKGEFVTKRIRAGVNSNTTHCQVYGCNKDLSNSKEYHRRHKVCEDHSKTSKVIVKGIEQRFCQQCSRFHLLAEFDDGKRSCRKRLAGHNERRRKPKVSRIHAGKLVQSYNGIATSRFHGTALASFICQDILPAGTLHHQNYGTSNWSSSRHMKVEHGSEFCPPSSIPVLNARSHSISLFPSENLDKSLPSFHGNETISATRSIFSESSNRYSHDLGGSSSQSLGNEHFSGITNSVRVLSLLSSQSHDLSSHSSGISVASPFAVVPGSGTHYSLSQASEKLIEVRSQFSTANETNKFPSSGTSSAEGSGLGTILLIDGSDAINVDIADGFYQGSNFVDARDRFSCEDGTGTTITSLQVSSQPDRVERQKQSMQVKQENVAFCWPHIT